MKKHFSTMSIDELLEVIENGCLGDKWIAVNRLIVICEDYGQAKKAYLATAKHCPEPSYGLLELMLGYADRCEILEILDIIENDDDKLEFLSGRAIEKYEDVCTKILGCRPYGKYYPSYGFKLLGELYTASPKFTCVKRESFEMLMEAANQMIERGETTKSRLKAFVRLNIKDEPKYLETRNVFQKWIDTNY